MSHLNPNLEAPMEVVVLSIICGPQNALSCGWCIPSKLRV